MEHKKPRACEGFSSKREKVAFWRVLAPDTRDQGGRVFGLTLEQCWHTVCQHCSREVLARANSTPGQVLAQGVLTAGSRGVRTHWRQVSANMTSKVAHILLKIARIFMLASARRRTRVPTVCQQRRWQVLEHCANSRIRAGVGTKSVLTVHLSVLTLERRP